MEFIFVSTFSITFSYAKRYNVRDKRYNVRDKRYNVRDKRYNVRDKRYNVRDKRYNVRDKRYNVRDTHSLKKYPSSFYYKYNFHMTKASSAH